MKKTWSQDSPMFFSFFWKNCIIIWFSTTLWTSLKIHNWHLKFGENQISSSKKNNCDGSCLGVPTLHKLCVMILALFLCLVAGLSPKYALQGASQRFSLDFVGPPNSILWKHDGKKVVEFDSREVHVYNPYGGRVTLNLQTAQLEITDLRFEDSGVYEVEVDINKNLHISNYKLVVIGKLINPAYSDSSIISTDQHYPVYWYHHFVIWYQ